MAFDAHFDGFALFALDLQAWNRWVFYESSNVRYHGSAWFLILRFGPLRKEGLGKVGLNKQMVALRGPKRRLLKQVFKQPAYLHLSGGRDFEHGV